MRKEDLQAPFLVENNNPSNSLIPNKQESLKKIYYVSLLCNVIVNFDHGIIPACTFKLKESLGIDDLFLGILGSMVFVGLMSGSLVSGYMFTKYQCKQIIIFSLSMISVGIFMFSIAGENKFLMIVSRLISGFFQVFLVVFYPVWVDYFADSNKTRWLTYLQIGVPFGVFLGYGLTAVFNVLEQSFPSFSVLNFFKILANVLNFFSL